MKQILFWIAGVLIVFFLVISFIFFIKVHRFEQKQKKLPKWENLVYDKSHTHNWKMIKMTDDGLNSKATSVRVVQVINIDVCDKCGLMRLDASSKDILK